MQHAITRSTFAYATFLFVVLFGPQVGFSQHDATGAPANLFPNVFRLLGMLAILYVAVRHATAGHAEARFARGFARGTAVSCIGAVLYAIGLAVIGAGTDSDAPGSTSTAAVLSAVFVAALGTGISALFAFLRRHGAGPDRAPA